jgi:glycosyltransferase involved in cell wall biosynthesis
MKLLLVHNDYGKLSGEEVVVEHSARLLRANGHAVEQFRRAGLKSPAKMVDSAKAFFSGVYNPISRREFKVLARSFRPDVIHIHNLYPLISPSVIDEAVAQRIPVVMTLHNYRILCPSGLFLSRGEVCTRCTGTGMELNCIVRNCEGGLAKSVGYAARNAAARLRGSFRKKVRRFIALSEFQKGLHSSAGIPASNISVVPNMVDDEISLSATPAAPGRYVGYIGRISAEKGVTVIVEAARRLPDIPFVFVGDSSRMPGLVAQAPKNCRFTGFVPRGEGLWKHYDEARFLVAGSLWFEAFPLNTLEAMARRRALICPRIGVFPEIIEDERSGLLYGAGEAEALAAKIRYLWDRPELAARMGDAGYGIWRDRYSSQAHYAALLRVYESVIRSP